MDNNTAANEDAAHAAEIITKHLSFLLLNIAQTRRGWISSIYSQLRNNQHHTTFNFTASLHTFSPSRAYVGERGTHMDTAKTTACEFFDAFLNEFMSRFTFSAGDFSCLPKSEKSLQGRQDNRATAVFSWLMANQDKQAEVIAWLAKNGGQELERLNKELTSTQQRLNTIEQRLKTIDRNKRPLLFTSLTSQEEHLHKKIQQIRENLEAQNKKNPYKLVINAAGAIRELYRLAIEVPAQQKEERRLFVEKMQGKIVAAQHTMPVFGEKHQAKQTISKTQTAAHAPKQVHLHQPLSNLFTRGSPTPSQRSLSSYPGSSDLGDRTRSQRLLVACF